MDVGLLWLMSSAFQGAQITAQGGGRESEYEQGDGE